MKTLITLIKKEWQYTIKTNRIWALVAVTIFFAFVDPILMKMLPDLLKDQLGGVNISQFMLLNEVTAIQNFISNQMEVATFVVILVFAGQLANELRKGWIMIPYHAKPKRWLYPLAKFIANILIMLPLVLISVGIANIYSALLFDEKIQSVFVWLNVSLGVWLHFMYVIAMVIFFDSFLLPLGATIGLSFLSLFSISSICGILGVTYPDTQLMNFAMALTKDFSLMLPTILQSLLVILLIMGFGLIRFQRFQLKRSW